MNELTLEQKEKLFADITATADTAIRESKIQLSDPMLNLSDMEFFNKYVKDVRWHPLQNHGLEELHTPFHLETADQDFPGQVNAYLDLLHEIPTTPAKILDVGCGWGRGVDILRRYYKVDVHGIDIQKPFIDYANKTYPSNKYFTDVDITDYNILLFMDSMHLMFSHKFINSIAQGTLLVVSDFFTPDTLEEFKNMIQIEKFECVLEKDQTDAVMKAMIRDIDTLKSRFKHIDKHIVNAYKHIQLNTLHQFKIGHTKQYKFVIKT